MLGSPQATASTPLQHAALVRPGGGYLLLTLAALGFVGLLVLSHGGGTPPLGLLAFLLGFLRDRAFPVLFHRRARKISCFNSFLVACGACCVDFQDIAVLCNVRVWSPLGVSRGVRPVVLRMFAPLAQAPWYMRASTLWARTDLSLATGAALLASPMYRLE